MSVTKEQITMTLDVVRCVAETIRDLGEVPNGILYAQLVGVVDLGTYEKIIGILKDTQLVKEEMHLLRWVGPKENEE